MITELTRQSFFHARLQQQKKKKKVAKKYEKLLHQYDLPDDVFISFTI